MDVVTGLSAQEAPTGSNGRARLPQWSSRSYASVVRANLLTIFKLILVGFGALTFVLRRLVRRSSSECHGKRCRNGSRVRAG
jgi:hypothetical protein